MVLQRSAGPIARTTASVLNPTTLSFGATPPVVPKLRRSGRSLGIEVRKVRSTRQWTKRFTSSSETESVGMSTSGSVVGRGEWGEDDSSVRAGGELSKERSKKWEKGDILLLPNELLTLPLNSLSPDNVPSPWSGIQLLAGDLPGPSSGALPAPVPQTVMDAPGSHSGSALRRQSPPLGRWDRWIDDPAQLFSLLCGCPFEKVLAKGEDPTDESKEGDQRVRRPDGCGSVGGTFFPLSVPFLESALRKPEGDEVRASRPCGVPSSKYQAFTRIGLRRTGT